MEEFVSCKIRCEHCGIWFGSPIQFGNDKAFFSSQLVGNKVQCHSCKEMTGCNKENMRFEERDGEGKVTIVEGKDAI